MRTAARLRWGAATALFALPLAAQQPPGLDVPYVPTPPQVVAQMLALATPTRDDVLYDLGSGDGRIVIEAARRFGTRGVGVDIDPVRVEAGQEMRIDCAWDRSIDPTREPRYIVFAEGTEDEMCFGTYSLIPDRQRKP